MIARFLPDDANPAIRPLSAPCSHCHAGAAGRLSLAPGFVQYLPPPLLPSPLNTVDCRRSVSRRPYAHSTPPKAVKGLYK
ncbi:hypothetical protein NEUTE1DRAFT_116516 [Neurospora tetrasperma FGSC 2508]|uniref:Uncharacterized protein n=1 Tax=Neurospora tetrasperma (strain FGSC 2508 / ATCC MYA-4615 / P0657) TaxID=510951 RepID=F8MGG0_NEUT8|nr:uncharacterized protein NEUTE1DRAFT_116516 [Neurospora tetrasperma FGSC 2508]EGO59432.1 hypothetical protein NEUTE1DRAFT_116516 [Neurospora tetrasperma FGSC 2508]EGZ73559.1 hypothetical protein NEUTE2DRAFT_144211 [Neurospora tetrasperma FGSC 2509]